MTGFLLIILSLVLSIKAQSNVTSNVTSNEIVNITQASYRCGEGDNECRNKELVCTFTRGSCQIYCQTERACENTTIRLGPSTSWLNMYCKGNSSCINAKITGVGTLTAVGQNALNGAYIQCMEGKTCSIVCQNSLSCANSEIDGTNSGYLDMQCKEYESCLDISIRCPPGAMNREFCVITGTPGNQAVIHNEFNIYAPHGWGDIRFVDYTAYTLSGKLYCAGNASFIQPEFPRDTVYSCDIQYGIWDCKDVSSPCTNQTWLSLDTETHICDGVDGGNTCNDEEIICNQPTQNAWDYFHPPRCNLLCIGANTCQNTQFQCHHEKGCNVVCAGDNSCNGLRVRGQPRDTGERAMSLPLNIICGREGNDAACQNSNFSAPLRADYLFVMNVNMFGTNNLRGTEIYGPQLWRGALHIQCNYNQSCQGAYIYDAFFSSSELVIQCNGEYDSCADMTVYCPNNDLCVIKGNSIDRNTELNLFCTNGWSDIDISEWNNAQIIYTIDTPSNDTIITTLPPINTTETPSFNITDIPTLNATDTPSMNMTDLPSFNVTTPALNTNTTTNITTLAPSNSTTTNNTNSTLGPIPNSTFAFPEFNFSSTISLNDTVTTFIPIDNTTFINLNIMHCGRNYEYQCEIDDNFNCSCPPITTSTPTSGPIEPGTPTMRPTLKPTSVPLPSGQTRMPTGAGGINATEITPAPTAENVDEWFVVGVTFIVLFAVVACILAYFAWVFHRADDKAFKGGYHKTDQEDIEAANLNETR